MVTLKEKEIEKDLEKTDVSQSKLGAEIIQWRQTNLIEYFKRKIHTMNQAIKVGLVLKQVGEQCEIAIGRLAHHVEKASGGRGLKGGINAFARGVGIPRATIQGWMKATATKELITQSRLLGTSKVCSIERAPDPETLWLWIDQELEKTNVPPSSRDIRKRIIKQKFCASYNPMHWATFESYVRNCLGFTWDDMCTRFGIDGVHRVNDVLSVLEVKDRLKPIGPTMIDALAGKMMRMGAVKGIIVGHTFSEGAEWVQVAFHEIGIHIKLIKTEDLSEEVKYIDNIKRNGD